MTASTKVKPALNAHMLPTNGEQDNTQPLLCTPCITATITAMQSHT
jgi:hypothetical protein